MTAAQLEDGEGRALVEAIHRRKQQAEVAAKLAEALKNQPGGVLVCYTKCWSCQFGEHTSTWHTWADEEDIEHAAKTGQPDPSQSRCGCYCQRSKERQ